MSKLMRLLVTGVAVLSFFELKDLFRLWTLSKPLEGQGHGLRQAEVITTEQSVLPTIATTSRAVPLPTRPTVTFTVQPTVTHTTVGDHAASSSYRQLADLPRLGEPECCTFEFFKERMDTVQRGVCGKPAKKLNLFSHGWGVDLMVNTGDKLGGYSFVGGQPFYLQSVHAAWHYADGVCPKNNTECYFYKVDAERVGSNKTNCHEIVPPLKENCCSDTKYLKIRQYFGYEYLTQVLPKYQELATKRAENLLMPPNTQCAVLHVRRSDTLLNKGWGGTGPPIYRNVSVAEYLDHARVYLQRRNISHVIVMTDDLDAIYETDEFKDEFTWHWLKRERFRGGEGGWENHFPSGNREKEVIDILALIYATRQCSVLIASASRFAMMHYEGMMIYQRNPWYVFVETRNGRSSQKTIATGGYSFAINKA